MPNLKNIEVELKFPLYNHEELIKQLNSIAESKMKEDYQRDTYYIPPHKNFLEKKPISEWLRIRETKNKSTVNYKNWHNSEDKKAVSCDEFETSLKDAAVLKNIFKNLDFKEIIVVEKNRKTWMYKNAKISVDNVAGLGYFIEIEAKENFSDINEAKKHIHSILSELNAKLGSQDFEGYPYQILKKKGLI